MVDVNLHPMV